MVDIVIRYGLHIDLRAVRMPYSEYIRKTKPVVRTSLTTHSVMVG